MLTEETREMQCCTAFVNEEQAKRAQAAMQELQYLVEDYFGAKGEITHLTMGEHPSVEI